MKVLSAVLPIVLATLFLSSCEEEHPPEAHVLAIGDSVIWWNIESGQSIADVVGRELGRDVFNASIPGAEFLAGRSRITEQYEIGPWEWVVLDGGANDLGAFCGTPQAALVLDRLIAPSADAGAMPSFLDRVRADGPQAVVMGYYMAPVSGGEFAGCAADFAELNRRLRAYAAQKDGVFFAPAEEVVDPAVLAHYDPDLIHPSPLGSRLMGAQIAEIIRAATDR